MLVPGPSIFQLGYVTEDIEAAARYFAEHFGMERFHFVRGQEGNRNGERRISLAYLKDMMIELIEPGDKPEALYKEALKRGNGGIALHHHGYLVEDDATWDAVEQAIEARGIPITRQGSAGTHLDYIYVDTTASLGHHIEYIRLGPTGKEFFAPAPRY